MRKHINQKARKSKLRVPLPVIERTVCQFFGASTEAVRSASMFARDRKIKGCVFALAKEFLQRSYKVLEFEYRINPSRTVELVNYVKQACPEQLNELRQLIYESQESRR